MQLPNSGPWSCSHHPAVLCSCRFLLLLLVSIINLLVAMPVYIPCGLASPLVKSHKSRLVLAIRSMPLQSAGWIWTFHRWKWSWRGSRLMLSRRILNSTGYNSCRLLRSVELIDLLVKRLEDLTNTLFHVIFASHVTTSVHCHKATSCEEVNIINPVPRSGKMPS